MSLGVSLHAQGKFHCVMNHKTMAYAIDSTDSNFFKITINVDSCTSTILNVPSCYYYVSDSIIVKIRKRNVFDGNNNLQVSYCQAIGPHNIALFINPDLFPISDGRDNHYSVELYCPIEKMRELETMQP